MANDTINHGASIAQETSIVVKLTGIVRGSSIVDNWSGNNAGSSFHILTEAGVPLTTESGSRLETEAGP